MIRMRAAGLAVLVALSAAVLCRGLDEPGTAEGPRSTEWLDPDGRPLPFRTDDEVLEFLRTAEVVEAKPIPVGITKPRKLLLERDGVRAHAVFRYVDEELKEASVGGRHYRRFLDSSRFECAAYELSRRLALDSVPPTVERRLSGRSGTLQIWLEGSLDETARGFKPPGPLAWARQTWDKDFFDNLILNVDRNSGNLLVDRSYRIWLIDHTRAFQPLPELLDPERLTRVSRAAWERLLALDEDALRDAVGRYMDGEAFLCLARRRELLIEHVRALVAQRGESVFY